jgi:hypothetical protein
MTTTETPEMTSVTSLLPHVFTSALKAALQFASTDQARPILTSVLFTNVDGSVHLVATDSYKLCDIDLETSGVAPFKDFMVQAVDCKRIITAIGKATVTSMSISGSGSGQMVAFEGDSSTTVKPQEGTFPEWRNLVPKADDCQPRQWAWSPGLMGQIADAALLLSYGKRKKGQSDQPVRYLGGPDSPSPKGDPSTLPQLFTHRGDQSFSRFILMPVRVPGL